MQNINKLLALVDQFAVIKRIEYDNQEHRLFVNNVLKTLQLAAIEIRAIQSLTTNPALYQPPVCGSGGSGATTSNAEPTSPEVGTNTHNPAEKPSKDDIAEAPCHKLDTAGKSAFVTAKIAAARKAAAARGRTSPPKPSPESTKTPSGSPQPEPQATGQTD